MSNKESSIFRILGPGLLFAGAAVGVSHLVQSTRAGAQFGLGLFGVVLLANVFKYPAFSFGPRYAASTGTSLLEGYRQQGRWALWLYLILTVGTMFTVQAAVTFVTGALLSVLIGWTSPALGVASYAWLSLLLTLVCAALLSAGHYTWLDRIVRYVVAVLTLSTIVATAFAIPKVPFATLRILPSAEAWQDQGTVLFVVALVGWMPSAFDVSIWNSLWTLAKRKSSGHAPSVREALFDFKIGYFGTAFLAFCFLFLGAGVMHASGTKFAAAAPSFAKQIIDLYTDSLGEWSRPLISISAFTVMFSTTLTVIDGFPRALSTLVRRFQGPEQEAEVSGSREPSYWIAVGILGVGSMLVILFLLTSLKALVDVATILSLLTAPFLAFLNHRAILGAAVPAEARPGKGMQSFSILGILFSLALAAYFLWIRFLA